MHPHQSYKERVRQELQRNLQAELDKRTSQLDDSQVSEELNRAVPPTETLNSEAAKAKAELARQGSLRERSAPAAALAAQAAAAAAVAAAKKGGESGDSSGSANSSFEAATTATPASAASSVAAAEAALAKRKRNSAAVAEDSDGAEKEEVVFWGGFSFLPRCFHYFLLLL